MGLKGCCCCFNLWDGSNAIGITMLVLGSLGLVYTVGSTIYMVQQPELDNSATAGQAASQIAACVIHLIFNALLVYGVGKNNRGMVLAWIIYHGIVTGLQSLGVVIIFVFTCISGVWWLLLLVLGVAALVGVFWYWFVVVLHHYQEMQQENDFVDGRKTNEGEKHAL